jgi:hypothetical protein
MLAPISLSKCNIEINFAQAKNSCGGKFLQPQAQKLLMPKFAVDRALAAR